MDFELTRSENDEALSSQLESIRSADNLQVLIPFAKAYLGMFYVIDKELPEKEKVELLANHDLAEALLSGFVSSLDENKLPSIADIGHAKAENRELTEGYVVLAGLDLVAKKSLSAIQDLPIKIIEAAIGFHFSNNSGYQNIWFDYLLEKDTVNIARIISQYWVAMLKNKTAFLPGRNLVLGDKPNTVISEHSILLLLEHWRYCKTKTLLQLLHVAFKYSNTKDLLAVCERVLENDDGLNERSRLYWIATAYLIYPDKYLALLTNYVTRVKLKIMPLLDFITLIMNDKNKTIVEINPKIIVQLLRLIAPIFPPQHHVYGAIGALDINSKNVLLMFYYLLCTDDERADSEIKLLRKARVMKIYSAVIDHVLKLRIQKRNKDGFSLPDFDSYIEILIEGKLLQSRSNKFDLR